jgi:phospholipid/cholesterol/gamma-HCH transport system substrate-binding protein
LAAGHLGESRPVGEASACQRAGLRDEEHWRPGFCGVLSGVLLRWRRPRRFATFAAMEKSRLETKVGLFVLIGLVLLAVLLLQFSKGTSLWRGTYELHLHAANVGGIKPRAAVLLAGVQVGSVADIRLAPDGKSVTMDLKIYDNYPIYHDARFVIEQSGFLGDQFISIVPNQNLEPKWTDGADVHCESPFNLQQVARDAAGFIQRIDETAKKLDASMTDLRREVLNAQTLASFGVAITNMKVFTEQALDTVQDINVIVNTNSALVGIAASNAVLFSEELIQLAGSARDTLASNRTNISLATKNMADTTATFKQLATDLEAGKGLAGAVLQSPELAGNLQAIAANLSVTSSNLNRLGLWGILWAHKPPATNQPSGTTKTTTALPPKK